MTTIAPPAYTGNHQAVVLHDVQHLDYVANCIETGDILGLARAAEGLRVVAQRYVDEAKRGEMWFNQFRRECGFDEKFDSDEWDDILVYLRQLGPKGPA